MKKLFSLCLALLLVLSLCACAAAPSEPTPDLNAPAAPDEGPTPVEIPALEANAGEETPAEEPEELPAEEAPATARPEGLTLGQLLAEDFMARAEAEPAIAALGMAEELMANPAILFAPVTMNVEPGLLNGFSNEEITGFVEAAIFAPMIGSIPFVGYVFRVDEGTDAQAFADSLEEKGNLSWNICTTADELVTAVSGSLVFFVMCPEMLEA